MPRIHFLTARTDSLRHRRRRERDAAHAARSHAHERAGARRRPRGLRRQVKHPGGPLAPVNDGWSGPGGPIIPRVLERDSGE